MPAIQLYHCQVSKTGIEKVDDLDGHQECPPRLWVDLMDLVRVVLLSALRPIETRSMGMKRQEWKLCVGLSLQCECSIEE